MDRKSAVSGLMLIDKLENEINFEPGKFGKNTYKVLCIN